MAIFDIFSLQEENINLLKRRAGERNPPALLPLTPSDRLTAVAYANGRNSKLIASIESELIILSLYAKQSFDTVNSNFQRANSPNLPISLIINRNFSDLKIWLLERLRILSIYNNLLDRGIINNTVESILNNLINTVLLGRYIKTSISGLSTVTRILGQEFIFQGSV